MLCSRNLSLVFCTFIIILAFRQHYIGIILLQWRTVVVTCKSWPRKIIEHCWSIQDMIWMWRWRALRWAAVLELSGVGVAKAETILSLLVTGVFRGRDCAESLALERRGRHECPDVTSRIRRDQKEWNDDITDMKW